MSFNIAIASGKGGTGKTTISVNLNRFLKQEFNKEVQLVDCDVEEPNDLLFFKDAVLLGEEAIVQMVPQVDENKCTFCGKCESYCEFNAISVIAKVNYISVDTDLCHSCGACLEACKFDAITEVPEHIGDVRHYISAQECKLSEGRLKIGSPMQTMLIKALKSKVPAEADIVLFDAPPGTSCPVVETISDMDYVVLVAEPTLFGFHDFKLMVDLVDELDKPFGVVINKAGLGDHKLYDYLRDKEITLLGEIPFSKEYASTYAKGELTSHNSQEILNAYKEIINRLPIQ